MILADTSVWIDHLRAGNAQLVTLLKSAQGLIYSFIMGEMACGKLRNRSEVLTLLGDVPGDMVAPMRRCCSSSSGMD